MGILSCDGEMVVRQNDECGFAGKKLASAKKILENIFWKWYHFGLKKTISFYIVNNHQLRYTLEWKQKNADSACTTIQEYMNRRACLENK